MIRKLIVTTLTVGLVAGVLVGGDLWSYATTAGKRVSSAVKDTIPTEFQIDRAREMVSQLTPEVRKAMHVIAKEEIELERLNEQISNYESQNAKSKGDIMRLQSDVSSGRNVFRYAGHSYSAAEVREDLSRRFTRFKVDEDTVTHLREMRDARTANLDAARQKLTVMISAQKKLETDVANLEAKKQLVEVAQASSEVIIDNSQLSRAKELIADIHAQLDVAAKLANADVNYQGEIPLDSPEVAADDIADQVANYFGMKPEAKVASYEK
jgi:phage shock protein A